jgi:hypothetical protein
MYSSTYLSNLSIYLSIQLFISLFIHRYRLQVVLPDLTPLFCALALTSIIIIISNSFGKIGKIYFQALLFGASFAGSVGYLIVKDEPQLKHAWDAFILLSFEIRLAIFVLLVTIVYFGGAMYISSPTTTIITTTIDDYDSKVISYIYSTPASIDNVVGFDIPMKLPEDDTKFFENMLDK